MLRTVCATIGPDTRNVAGTHRRTTVMLKTNSNRHALEFVPICTLSTRETNVGLNVPLCKGELVSFCVDGDLEIHLAGVLDVMDEHHETPYEEFERNSIAEHLGYGSSGEEDDEEDIMVIVGDEDEDQYEEESDEQDEEQEEDDDDDDDDDEEEEEFIAVIGNPDIAPVQFFDHRADDDEDDEEEDDYPMADVPVFDTRFDEEEEEDVVEAAIAEFEEDEELDDAVARVYEQDEQFRLADILGGEAESLEPPQKKKKKRKKKKKKQLEEEPVARASAEERRALEAQAGLLEAHAQSNGQRCAGKRAQKARFPEDSGEVLESVTGAGDAVQPGAGVNMYVEVWQRKSPQGPLVRLAAKSLPTRLGLNLWWPAFEDVACRSLRHGAQRVLWHDTLPQEADRSLQAITGGPLERLPTAIRFVVY